MSVVENIDRPTNQDLGLNARVIDFDEMTIEPLRQLMSDFGAHGVVDDLDDIMGILISILHQPGGTNWKREYLQDKMYAINKLRIAFTKLERSTVHEVKPYQMQAKQAG